MKIIKPFYEILTELDRQYILKTIEMIGRTCYKSEDKITEESASKFVKDLISRGHTAMIEFKDITVKFIHNRGFSHEMVRHRLCNFAQESTRYCDYMKDKHGNEITVIEPYWYESDHMDQIESMRHEWQKAMLHAQQSYKELRLFGVPPQGARGVLPIDIKTEIMVKANLREWRHIFELRCGSGAHPDMKRIMNPLRNELATILPEIFGDLVK